MKERKRVVKHSCGYLMVYRPEHPYCNQDGRVPEHRIVVEESLGIIINPRTHHVHHIDKNRANNSLDNLMLLTVSEHLKMEQGWRKKDGKWHKTCKSCLNWFEVSSDNFYERSNGIFYYHCVDCSKGIARYIANNNRFENKCTICSKTFFIKYYAKNPIRFCSRKCIGISASRRHALRKLNEVICK